MAKLVSPEVAVTLACGENGEPRSGLYSIRYSSPATLGHLSWRSPLSGVATLATALKNEVGSFG